MKKYQNVIRELQNFIDKKNICGAYVKVRENGELVLDEGLGVQDPAANEQKAVTEDTVYRLASMTKPITSAAVMLLWEEGKLSLDDPVKNYLPGYTGDGRDDIRIIHLLNHSCGLGMIGFPGMVRALVLTEREDRLSDRVNRWAALTPDFPAGSATGYSPNVGFDILGRIVEIVSGQEFDQFLKERIFQPLGMKDTGFLLNDEQKSRLAVLLHDENYIPEVPVPADFGEKMNDSVDASINGYFSGAAGLFGTAADYEKFALMLLNEGRYQDVQLLRPETVRLMRTPSNDLQAKPDILWGIGMQVFGNPQKTGYKVNAGSFGWSGAYGTHFYVDPEGQRTVLLMLNADGLGGSESYISRAVEKAVFEENQ